MRNWLFYLLIILFPVSTWAQEMMVQGRVVDAETGEALPYVSIYVEEGKGTLSNDDGDFKLTVDKSTVLRFSYIGYERMVIKTAEMPDTIRLKPYSISMREVTVQAENIDKILKQTKRNLKHDFKKCGKWTRKYFFRTYTEMDEGTYIAEAFMKAYSVVNIRSATIQSGLEGCDTEGNGGTLNMFDSNIHRLVEVAPMTYDSKFWQDAIKPLKSLSALHKCYRTKLMYMQSEDGKALYKIEFKWKKKQSASWPFRDINITGTAYVDAETCRLLRFDGSCNNCTVYTGWLLSLPTAINFHLEYDYSQGAASISHLAIHGGNSLTYYRALLFAIEPDEKKPGKIKDSGANMVTAIKKAGFKAKLWKEYDIVKRTKEEERAAFGDKKE